MKEYCYSTNDEDFRYESLTDAVEAKWDDIHPLGEVGDVLTIWQGETFDYDVSAWIYKITEALNECAYDAAGDVAGDWPDCTPQQSRELQDLVGATVVGWLERNRLMPQFRGVKGIKEITVRMLDMGGKFEIVEEGE